MTWLVVTAGAVLMLIVVRALYALADMLERDDYDL
jgi:hypothetical protein